MMRAPLPGNRLCFVVLWLRSRSRTVAVASALFVVAAGSGAGVEGGGAESAEFEMMERVGEVAEALRARAVVGVREFDHAEWSRARAVRLTRYWSGADAPKGRHAEARVLWDAEGLGVRFAYRQEEPPVVADAPRVDRKTVGLWERDVCEVFVAPDAARPEEYYEFEAAPTGEWLDLKIRWRPAERETDWEFKSGMRAAARVKGKDVTIIMRVPWSAFGRVPRAGERWRANFFRCAGRDPDRGYMVWRPTRTPEPSYHVPSAFGELHFKD